MARRIFKQWSFSNIVSNNREILYYAIALFLVTFATRATNNMINTTAPLLARYIFLFPNILVGILASIGSLINLATVILINARLPGSVRRRLFLISNALIIILLVLYYVSNPTSIWGLAIITGFAYGVIMPNILTSASIVGDQFTAERLLVLYTLALSTSLVVGPLFETYLLTHLTYRDVFLIFTPLAIIAFTFSFRLKFPPDPPKHRRAGILNHKAILKNRGFVSAVLATTTYSIPFAVFTTFIAIYAQSIYHVNKYLAYFSFVPFFLTSFLTRLYLTIKVPGKLFIPMITSIIITSIGIILLYASPTYIAFLVAMTLLGIPHGSTYPLSTLMLSRGTRIEERNTANSYFSAYQGIIAITMPAIFGYLADAVGLRLSMLLLLIPVIITGIVFGKYYVRAHLDHV